MPVSAYVIRCSPDDRPAVLNQLRAITGLEVGETNDTGIAVATDTPTTRAAAELGERLQQLPGVKAAVLVYHNFEDVAEAKDSVAVDVSPLHSSSGEVRADSRRLLPAKERHRHGQSRSQTGAPTESHIPNPVHFHANQPT